MKKYLSLFALSLYLFNCAEDASLKFEDSFLSLPSGAKIEVLYPKAKGSSEAAKNINTTIDSYIANQLSFNDSIPPSDLKDAIEKFNTEYTGFKDEFKDTEARWEALVEGEVQYQSPEILCISINTYLYTGGAHGNDRIDFLNFNPNTGQQYSTQNLISDMAGFSKLVETNLKKEQAKKAKDKSMEDLFFGKDFQLPESIGFNEDGVIILYNTYEIASYAQGITEFLIPYSEANAFLSIN
ncbi:DUF3298 and DUF4163 domain-containing protein [Mangrovimonas sp. DI 80]|uniref:DUF3298 and DUF4163 domain-containing protein n=1 Tax=Mangrovimonas sp. DI 80 TaxID=1779330 RepID=UPI00097581CA|nr:DUF3298 and DUF4163 domain-containing protein [Mangrovimonas sp. DI 80]OMP32507.1 hypothetical protein BKM32_05535 [Mangrovimonas sp. DI 80]